MANSKIIITFSQDLPLNAQLGITIGYNTNPPTFVDLPIDYLFNWVDIRGNTNEVTIGLPTGTPGERSAINFVEAFNADLFGFVVTRNINVVTIEFVTIGSIGRRYTVAYFISPITTSIPNHPSIGISIFNATMDNFTITNSTFNTAVVPCTHAKLNITTNVLATKILSPIVVNPNSNNPFSFEVLRGVDFELKLENANGTIISQIYVSPSILNPLNFNVLVNNGPTSASVIIENSNNVGLTFQYSLNNINFQTSNIFSSVLPGYYIVYVKDNLGCQIQKTFIVDEFGIKVPNFYISKSNSIRFANRITFGDSENYKNDENTLSCEVDVKLAYKEIQFFQSADVITTQFKSNYTTNIAKVIKADATEVVIPIIKKTNNIGIKEKRDARKINLGGGKTGVYFISGNIYDYNTNLIIGPYVLNGLLPEWAIIGNYFQMSGVWYLIENIVYDQVKNADVLVFTNIYTGLEVNVIAGTIYNRENYEVYEFSIDMVNYIEQKFRVELLNSDPKFTALKHLSEEIYCKVKHEQTLEISYFNNTNTDILYSTGIIHKIRQPYNSIKGISDESSQNHKTDTDVVLLDAEIYEADDIVFEPVTKEIWKKIKIALSHENVLINSVAYVKKGDFNTEGPLGQSNLFVLTASMIKSGNVYNSKSSGNSGFTGTEIEIPGLIETEVGFVKY